MKRRRLLKWCGAAVALLLLFGGRMACRHYAGGTILTLDGRRVADLSASEVGDLADPQFRKVRQVYLTNLPRYREAAATPIPAEAAAAERQVRGVVEQMIDDSSRRAVASLPPGAAEDLSQRIALVLRRIGGLSAEDYLAAVAGEPLVFDAQAIAMADYDLGRAPSPSDARPAAERERERDFCDVYNLVRDYENGDRLARAWAGASPGTRCVAAAVPTPVQFSGLIYDGYAGGDERFFQGSLSTGSSVSHRPAADWNRIRATYDSLVRFELLTIVADRGGDAYPLSMTFYYLPETKRWWLQGVGKFASPRAASAPAFVF